MTDSPLFETTRKYALLSEDGAYRYVLTRDWSDDPATITPRVLWIMLNPSTADHEVDDRTIGRCMDFARRWGYDGITVVNLYAARSPYPDALKLLDDPVGPDNYDTVATAIRAARDHRGLVVAAWGSNPGRYRGGSNVDVVARTVTTAKAYCVTLHAVRVNADGSPGHPLYVPGTATPTPWSSRV